MEHPITPPPELFRQWKGMPRSLAFEAAYRAGADQELWACHELLDVNGCPSRWLDMLRARRPKPPSLAEQAMDRCNDYIDPDGIIRTALERLQQLEQQENND